jgi:stearoyl-CoA desaturase (delta-9 desaturase)
VVYTAPSQPAGHPQIEETPLTTALIIIATAAIVTQACVLATSIYLHRALAHRSLTLHPAADLLFRVVLWLTTGMPRQQWVAVHRKHHTYTDKEGDPHSPLLLGFWKVQLFNVFYYLRDARNPEVVRKWAPDLEPDAIERRVFSWGWTGVGLCMGMLMLAIGWWQGMVAMVLHGFLYVFVLSPSINGLGHWRGRQNFENTAYNQRVLAWFTGGESLHNNHHAYPRAPRFSVRRLEFDPSWPVIKLMAALRLIGITGQTVSLGKK